MCKLLLLKCTILKKTCIEMLSYLTNTLIYSEETEQEFRLLFGFGSMAISSGLMLDCEGIEAEDIFMRFLEIHLNSDTR